MNVKKIFNIAFVVLFQIAEIVTLLIIGRLLDISYVYIVYVMAIFFLGRTLLGKPMHYKSWQKCFIWTTLVFTSMFTLLKIDLFLAILVTLFAGFVLTGRANLTDLFMWKGKTTKYQDIIDYIKYHPLSDNLVQFEENVKKQDDVTYLIYKYRFKDELSFSEISERLQMDTQRITEYLDKIAFAIRLYCKI